MSNGSVSDFFQGSQIRARDGCGGRAVSIQTTVGLLYSEIYSTGVIMKSISCSKCGTRENLVHMPLNLAKSISPYLIILLFHLV